MGVMGAAIATVLAPCHCYRYVLLFCQKGHCGFSLCKPFLSSRFFSSQSDDENWSSYLYPKYDFYRNLYDSCKIRIRIWRCSHRSSKSGISNRIHLLDDRNGFAAAVNSFTAQNYGANNQKRIHRGYSCAMGIVFLWGTFCTLLFLSCCRLPFSIFISSQRFSRWELIT